MVVTAAYPFLHVSVELLPVAAAAASTQISRPLEMTNISLTQTEGAPVLMLVLKVSTSCLVFTIMS